MSEICQACVNKIRSNQLRVACGQCEKIFHGTCVNISSAEINFLKTASKLWFCSVCTDYRRRSRSVSDLPSAVTSLPSDELMPASQFSTLLTELKSIKHSQDALTASVTSILAKQVQLAKSVELCTSAIKQHASQLDEHSASLSACVAQVSSLRVAHSDMVMTVTSVKEELMHIMDILPSTTGGAVSVGSTASDYENIIHEVMDRQSRACNVVVFSLVETDDDRICFSRLLSAVAPSIADQEFQCSRLGKHRSHGRCRPLKVTFGNNQLVRILISKAALLKTTSEFRNVTISYDRTPKQIEIYRSTRRELQHRLSSGETNLVIKHIHGVPKIVTMNAASGGVRSPSSSLN